MTYALVIDQSSGPLGPASFGHPQTLCSTDDRLRRRYWLGHPHLAGTPGNQQKNVGATAAIPRGSTSKRLNGARTLEHCATPIGVTNRTEQAVNPVLERFNSHESTLHVWSVPSSRSQYPKVLAPTSRALTRAQRQKYSSTRLASMTPRQSQLSASRPVSIRTEPNIRNYKPPISAVNSDFSNNIRTAGPLRQVRRPRSSLR